MFPQLMQQADKPLAGLRDVVEHADVEFVLEYLVAGEIAATKPARIIGRERKAGPVPGEPAARPGPPSLGVGPERGEGFPPLPLCS